MTPVRFTDKAAHPLEAALQYIERDSPTAGVLVGDRIRMTLERIATFPDSGSPTTQAGIRYAPVPHTRYLLFYRVNDTGVQVIRVRHASRRPRHK